MGKWAGEAVTAGRWRRTVGTVQQYTFFPATSAHDGAIGEGKMVCVLHPAHRHPIEEGGRGEICNWKLNYSKNMEFSHV